MTRKEKKNYFLLYSALFLFITPAVYYVIWSQGKTFIETSDGFNQHYHALMYYGKWLRKILKTLWREHCLSVPEWDFSIGYGSNVLTTLHYYVIGDPLTLLSALVPSGYTVYLYCFLVVLRNYLSGLAFSGFCIYMGKKNRTALLAGTFTYAFCAYALVAGTRHPFFANPLIYFPLVLLGVEKIFRGERPYLLVFSVFLSETSNFYFFYMIALLTALYVLARCLVRFGWKQRKEAFLFIGKITICALTGALLGAFLFVPVVKLFLGDYRSGVKRTLSLLYGSAYYKQLAAAFIGAARPGSWTWLGYGVAALPAAVLLLLQRQKKYRTEKLLFLAGTCFLLSPLFGYTLNGFSYSANRWTWGYSLLTAYILTEMWEKLFCARKRDLCILAAAAVLYAVLYRNYKTMRLTLPLLFAALALMALSSFGKSKRKPCARFWAGQMMLGLLLVGLVYNAFCQYDESVGRVGVWMLDTETVQARENENPDSLIAALSEEEDGFYRYTGTSAAVQNNSTLNNGTSNMQFYWSLSNGSLSRFFAETETLVHRLYYFNGLNGRALLDALLGGRWYVCTEKGEACVPYGYRFLTEQDGYYIYEKEDALPLAYTYDSYITEEQAGELTGIQKEEAMAQSVILEEEAKDIRQGEPVYTEEELSYTIKAGEGVELLENGFSVTQKDAKVQLHISAGEEAEVYLRLTGYSYQNGTGSEGKLTIRAERSSKESVGRTLEYYTAYAGQPTQMQDFSVNLGYAQGEVTTITLTFQQKGTYCYDALQVYARPVENDDAWLLARAADAWEDEEIGTDTVQGKVTLDEEKLLFLSIPYDGGWTAYVDGEKTEVLKANYAFTALKVPAGAHKILLVYRTPGLRMGVLLSLAGLAALIGMAGYRRRKSVREKSARLPAEDKDPI